MKTYKQPSSVGRFGEFGGMYVSETLMPLLLNLDQSYKKIQKDKKFKKELNDLFKNYVGRPSSLHYAKNLSKYINGPKVYFKSCLLYTSPSPRDRIASRMPSSA